MNTTILIATKAPTTERVFDEVRLQRKIISSVPGVLEVAYGPITTKRTK